MKHLDDAKAAVASCVSVLAAVTDQPEAVLIKWLDLYYQVRHAYELERGTTPEPQLLRADEVWPALREILREELRSAAEERIAAAACALPRNDVPEAPAAEGSRPSGERQEGQAPPLQTTDRDARGKEEDLSTPLRFAQDDRVDALRSAQDDEGARIAAPACAPARNDEAGGASPSPTGEGDLPPAILATSPGGGKGPGPWVRYKQKVAAKLAAARAQGVPIVRIAEASGGALSEGRVIDAINAGLLNKKEWSALDKALDLVTADAAGAE